MILINIKLDIIFLIIFLLSIFIFTFACHVIQTFNIGCFSHIQKKVYLAYLKFSKEAFEKTVKASANCDRVVFYCSQIDLSSDIDLSGTHYYTSYLSFFGVGKLKESDWKKQPERLERVIKAISLCSMKDSLKTFNIWKCDIGVKEVEQMMKKYKLDNVQVTDE